VISKTLLLITRDGEDISGIISIIFEFTENSMTKAIPGKKINSFNNIERFSAI